MELLLSLNEYKIYKADEDHHNVVYQILGEAVISATGSSNKRMRESKKLHARVRRAIRNDSALIMLKDDIEVAACIYDMYNNNVLTHINVLPKHRIDKGTGVLMHYLLNKVFKDEPVFFWDEFHKFEYAAKEVSPGLYELDTKIAKSMLLMFGEL